MARGPQPVGAVHCVAQGAVLGRHWTGGALAHVPRWGGSLRGERGPQGREAPRGESRQQGWSDAHACDRVITPCTPPGRLFHLLSICFLGGLGFRVLGFRYAPCTSWILDAVGSRMKRSRPCRSRAQHAAHVSAPLVQRMSQRRWSSQQAQHAAWVCCASRCRADYCAAPSCARDARPSMHNTIARPLWEQEAPAPAALPPPPPPPKGRGRVAARREDRRVLGGPSLKGHKQRAVITHAKLGRLDLQCRARTLGRGLYAAGRQTPACLPGPCRRLLCSAQASADCPALKGGRGWAGLT
jgi:hypothetical protein